jgi:hypothetical protein
MPAPSSSSEEETVVSPEQKNKDQMMFMGGVGMIGIAFLTKLALDLAGSKTTGKGPRCQLPMTPSQMDEASGSKYSQDGKGLKPIC